MERKKNLKSSTYMSDYCLHSLDSSPPLDNLSPGVGVGVGVGGASPGVVTANGAAGSPSSCSSSGVGAGAGSSGANGDNCSSIVFCPMDGTPVAGVSCCGPECGSGGGGSGGDAGCGLAGCGPECGIDCGPDSCVAAGCTVVTGSAGAAAGADPSLMFSSLTLRAGAGSSSSSPPGDPADFFRSLPGRSQQRRQQQQQLQGRVENVGGGDLWNDAHHCAVALNSHDHNGVNTAGNFLLHRNVEDLYAKVNIVAGGWNEIVLLSFQENT